MSSAEDDLLGSFLSEINSLPAAQPDVVEEEPKEKIIHEVSTSTVDISTKDPYTFSGSNSADLYSNSYSSTIAPAISFPSSTYSSAIAPVNYLQRDETGAAKVHVRKAADTVWEDKTLSEWPENDYRLFIGDLAKEATVQMLTNAFNHYKSFARAKVVFSKVDIKARGYGFVSFLDPMDCAKALREMNGKYLGSRPMKIEKSSWKDREIGEVKKKAAKKRKMDESLGLA